MLLDEQRVDQIKKTFKAVYEFKELARGHNASASDQMKGLVESLSTDKEERKVLKKVMKKAYVEWKESNSGEEDTLTEALQVIEKLNG